MTKFESTYNNLCEEIAKGLALKEKAEKFKSAFEAAESGITFLNLYPEGQIICCVKTRADFAPIRALHAGKWSKGITKENEARYSAVVDGVPISVVVSELPPSCKIIEDVVEVPASPARQEIVRRVVCNDATSLREPATI
jgi:hypothetical protein